MDGHERGKSGLRLCLAAAGIWVMQQAPKNQFSHRKTVRLLRSEMTDWKNGQVAACLCVCVFV